MTPHSITYLIIVAGLGLLAFIWVHIRINSFRDRRVERAEKLDVEEIQGVPGEELSRREKKKRREVLSDGVDRRFTVIGRTIKLSLGLVWVAALSLPLLGNLPKAYVSIAITAFTVIVGIAARPFFENLFCGIVISFSNQLRVGDTLIIDGQYGSVEDISVTHTKIKTWESKRYIIPNSRMLTKEFENLTLTEQAVWATVDFNVSYEVDMEQVQETAERIAGEMVASEAPEGPFFWIRRLDKDAIQCSLTCWSESPGAAWMLRSNMALALAREFRTGGITTNVSHLKLPRTPRRGERP